jgi:predicted dehydrogenase
VLSQKPFVLDLDVGERIADLAAQQGVRLAVNQNGRWAPFFSYQREAVWTGLLGDIHSVHLGVHWDHTWVAGSEFENVKHLVLYDFGIHWFDFLTTCLRDRKPRRVTASTARTATQKVRPALMAQAMVEYDTVQASLAFDGDTPHGKLVASYLSGDRGTIRSTGPSYHEQHVTLSTAEGDARPQLQGSWFTNGFHGTMAELLCAIEENREPTNSAASVLESLALCFAATASADQGIPIVPGEIRRMPG